MSLLDICEEVGGSSDRVSCGDEVFFSKQCAQNQLKLHMQLPKRTS